MLELLLFCAILCLWPCAFTHFSPSSPSPHNYKFIRLDLNSTIYLVNRGYRQMISFHDELIENRTVQSFGFNVSLLPILSLQALQRYPEHPIKITPVIQLDDSPDEIMRIYKLKAAILQRNAQLLKSLTKFGNCIHPTLPFFQGLPSLKHTHTHTFSLFKLPSF